MAEQQYKALVVDDDRLVRGATARALSMAGFDCEAAGEGDEALAYADKQRFDVVVTDLRMPKRHGHSLALELLKRDDCPLIFVLTGVAEPRLARDLLARGVDDVMFKPVDFDMLATKVRMAVSRRKSASGEHTPSVQSAAEPSGEQDAQPPQRLITRAEIEQKLNVVSRVLPISQAALDAYNLAHTEECDSHKLAEIVQRESSLTAEVLRLANSAFFNPSGDEITDLDKAITRLGHTRVGELALVCNALSSLTKGAMPWLDTATEWRRSVAARLAVEMLSAEGGHAQIDKGLALSAAMHNLGRVVLATLYPKHYEAMIESCAERREALLQQESRLFEIDHASTMSRLLAIWNIPEAIHGPLQRALGSYRQAQALGEPMRTKVQLVKVAIFVARVAVGGWKDWDYVELPPADVLERLKIRNLQRIIERTKEETDRLAARRKGAAHADRGPAHHDPILRLPYVLLGGDPVDALALLLPACGILPQAHAREAKEGEPVLINALGCEPEEFRAIHDSYGEARLLIVCDEKSGDALRQFGTVIPLPRSFGQVAGVLREAQPVP